MTRRVSIWRQVTHRVIFMHYRELLTPEEAYAWVNVKPVLVYLTHAQHAALLKLKEKLGVPVSEQIRGAIDRYLKHMESRK